jgi:ABC-type antimicrobial peptide transport system permease subunit
VNIYYNSQVNENHYGDIFPETMTLVGAYDPILDTMSFSESYVLEESLIIRLNNAYPYDDPYLSVINQSVKLEEFVEEVTSEDFNSMFLNFVPFYDREVFINTEGSFNLFKAVVTIENSVVPTTKTILTGSILFTFVLMFLFSYLSVLNNQKRIGIFRSLGYRRFDILKMFIVENGVVLLVSLLIGGIACLLLLSNLNSIIFSETIFTELMLYRFDTTSLLVSILVIASLMIVTSAFPLYRVLKLTPINIINRD